MPRAQRFPDSFHQALQSLVLSVMPHITIRHMEIPEEARCINLSLASFIKVWAPHAKTKFAELTEGCLTYKCVCKNVFVSSGITLNARIWAACLLTKLLLSAEVPDFHEQGLCLRPGQSLHVSFRPQRSQGTCLDSAAHRAKDDDHLVKMYNLWRVKCKGTARIYEDHCKL